MKYTKELLEPIVSSSISFAEILRKLRLKPTGGNYVNLQRNIDKFGISTDHMLNQASNAGREFVPFENLTRNGAIKKRLLKKRGHQCEKCMNTEWLGKPITIELEHIDGNNRNNTETNLKLLCPNCHAQTPTWKNRKRR
jgi:hypothetical protein